MKILFCLIIFLFQVLVSQQHNFYLGINAGISGIAAKRDDFTINDQRFYKSLKNDSNVNSKSGLAGLFIGYLFRLENFGIGTELFAEYDNLESTLDEKYYDELGDDNNSVSIKYKLTSPFGINIKFGYFVCNNFVYALFGWQKQKLKYQANLTNTPAVGLGVPPGRVMQQFAQNKNRYINGMNLGLGVQRPINENYSVGLEFKVAKASARNFEIDFHDNYDTKLFSGLHAIRTYSCSLRFMYTF